MKTSRLDSRRWILVVASIAFLLSAGMFVRLLAENDWDPSLFVTFGEDAPAITEYGESVLGREVVVRPDGGHDGKFFFIQANDPWLLDPRENIELVDRPTYRAQRMLYPVVASLGGVLDAGAIVWAMVVVNLCAMTAGSWAVARLAADLGGSPFWGLAFVANPGFISEQLIDGSGIVAAAAAFWAIQMLNRGRWAAGPVLLAGAVLAREATLVVALGVAVWAWRYDNRRRAVPVLVVPVLAALLWAVYVRIRLDGGAVVPEVNEIGLPFAGLIATFQYRSVDIVHMVARGAIVLLFALYLRQWFVQKGSLVAWAFVGFVPLALLFSDLVWASYVDITRAVAPLITALFLLYFVTGRSGSSPARAGGVGIQIGQ